MIVLRVRKDFRWNGILCQSGEEFNPTEGGISPTPSEIDRLLKHNFIYVDYFQKQQGPKVEKKQEEKKQEKQEEVRGNIEKIEKKEESSVVKKIYKELTE